MNSRPVSRSRSAIRMSIMLAYPQPMPEGQQQHRKIANGVAAFARCSEEASDLSFGQRILWAAINGIVGFDLARDPPFRYRNSRRHLVSSVKQSKCYERRKVHPGSRDQIKRIPSPERNKNANCKSRRRPLCSNGKTFSRSSRSSRSRTVWGH
jgi:hypothetical protein